MEETLNGMYQKNTRTAVPLRSIAVNATVEGFISTTHILSEFWNNETNPIEVDYTWPILDSQVVRSLEMTMPDGSVISAKVEELEKAKQTYDDTIASGNTGLLMQNSGSHTQYVLSIGNLPRKSGVKVELVVVSPLKCESSKWSYVPPPNLFRTGEKY